jgi:catechol 2,3-dioxygenase-like lactoylglutathione lyase family enzyme
LKAVRETPDYVFLSDGQGGRIEVQAYGEPALAHPSHLAFGVPLQQFDAIVDNLRARGVRVDEPRTMSSGDRLFYFNDPAGNRAQVVARQTPLPV